MNKMPQLLDFTEVVKEWVSTQPKWCPTIVPDLCLLVAKAQRELLEGYVELPSEERLAEILLGCFLAWQRDEENKTFPEYVANRLYKLLTEAK